MKKRPSITLLTVLLAMVFAAGIGVYSSYIGMKIYQESSDHLLESFSQISKTFTLFVQRNWTVLSQWNDLMSNAPDDENIDSIWPDVQDSKASWHYSDFYLFNESTQYLTADGRRGSVDSISGVIQEMYSEGGPIVSTYTASYGVPKIVFAMPLSRNMTLDGVTYTGLAVSYDTDVVDDLVDGSMYGLFNERYFSRVLNICEEKKLPFVLYYLDLDRFKPINDTYGHLMGDRLLKEIAARLLRCIRSRDYAFRIGGDEFALIVSADMDEGQRARMAERIQTTLSAPVVLDGTELSVGVSCGCACYPEDGSASQVRIAADSRMYETKQRHHENDRTEGES